MKANTAFSPASFSHDISVSLCLLTLSLAGGWLAGQSPELSGSHSVHIRLLTIFLVHPFALAAWLFCGLPGAGLAAHTLHRALVQHRLGWGILSVVLLALGLASATLWF